MTRPDMSIKVERQLHDMRILGRIVGVRSTEQFVWHLLTPTSFISVQYIFIYLINQKEVAGYGGKKESAPKIEKGKSQKWLKIRRKQ